MSRVWKLPLSPGPTCRVALLSVPSLMTGREWAQFHSVLATMQPVLTHDPMPCEFGPGYVEDKGEAREERKEKHE